MSKRITEKHPFMEKVKKLYDFMEELGIEIENNGMGGLNINDRENSKSYSLKDIDSSDMVEFFPTGYEFKLTFED
jgi:hypothetical protein